MGFVIERVAEPRAAGPAAVVEAYVDDRLVRLGEGDQSQLGGRGGGGGGDTCVLQTSPLIHYTSLRFIVGPYANAVDVALSFFVLRSPISPPDQLSYNHWLYGRRRCQALLILSVQRRTDGRNNFDLSL